MFQKIQNLMKTNNFLSKTAAFAAILSLGVAMSCQENEDPFAEEAAYVAEESVTDYYYEDADDMAMVAVASDEGTAGGKLTSGTSTLNVNDDRFCAIVLLTFNEASTLNHPIGSLDIDFGTGCPDVRGNVRSGRIKVEFNGRRFLPGSSITITFVNYYINGIKLSGTRTLTNISGSNEDAPKFQIELENGLAVWPDGTEATREHCFVREWVRAVNPINDLLFVNKCTDADITAEGTNRRGVAYKMIILEKLVYKRGCPIAVAGVKKFIVVSTGKEIIVDYGDRTCDRAVIITVNGTSRSVDVRKRG
jgi:hypothetical protein